MIIPNRHTNIRLCILRIGSLIVDRVQQNGPTRSDELISSLEASIENLQNTRIVEALIFLYAMGIINYLEQDDVFILQAELEEKASA